MSADAPDILEIGNISGFYGPGAWSAWFLAFCASIYRIWAWKDTKIDLNLWIWLLGTNWAAIDLLRHWLKFQRLQEQSDTNDAWKQEVGPVAAAMTVVSWGVPLATALLLFTVRKQLDIRNHDWEEMNIRTRDWKGKLSRRALSLFLGISIPNICASIYFWRTYDNNRVFHDPFKPPLRQPHIFKVYNFIGGASSIGYMCMLCMVPYFLANMLLMACLYSIVYGYSRPRFMSMRDLKAQLLDLLDNKSLMNIVAFCQSLGFIAMGAANICSFISLLASIASEPAGLPPAYYTACSIVPCTVHKITDMDQAFALFIGVISFGWEVASHLLEIKRKKKKETAELWDRFARLLQQRGDRSATAPDASTCSAGVGENVQMTSAATSGEGNVVRRTNTASAIV